MSPFRLTSQNCDGDVREISEAIVTKYGQPNYESVITDRQLVYMCRSDPADQFRKPRPSPYFAAQQ